MAPPGKQRRPGGGGAAVITGNEITSDDSRKLSQINPVLKAHFDRAVGLLEQKAELAADVAEWRRQARAEGLVPTVIIRLARQRLRTADERRRAAELAEVEELYRQGLGLPLFDYARRSAE